jgi:hypothetical protein
MKTLLWLISMYRIRRWYWAMLFSDRCAFLAELRPKTADGNRIAWPDAIFHVTDDDIGRADLAVENRQLRETVERLRVLAANRPEREAKAAELVHQPEGSTNEPARN